MNGGRGVRRVRLLPLRICLGSRMLWVLKPGVGEVERDECRGYSSGKRGGSSECVQSRRVRCASREDTEGGVTIGDR